LPGTDVKSGDEADPERLSVNGAKELFPPPILEGRDIEISSSPSLSQGRSFRSVSISGRDICRPFTCVAAEHARLVIIYLVYQL
jgi:hypothetical protein